MKNYIIAEVMTHSGYKQIVKRCIDNTLIWDWRDINNTFRKPLVRELKDYVLHDYQKVFRSICTDNWYVYD